MKDWHIFIENGSDFIFFRKADGYEIAVET